jgi:lipoprotein NlpI
MPNTTRFLGSLLFAAAVLAANPAAADNAQDRAWKDCEQRTDLDLRIVGCTKVLADGDDEDADRAVAFNNRGNAQADRGDYARAIADYTEAAKLDPDYTWAYANRGRAYLFTGALAKARADFEQAVKLDADSAYLALWLDIANRRNGAPSRLKAAAENLDMDAWPGTVVRLYLGELTPAQALAAAKTPDQVCEVNFYSGELALARKDRDGALRLFQTASSTCAAGLIEGMAAKAEIKALAAKE